MLRKVNTGVYIANQAFPVLAWTATLANQGNMGTATASCALSDLIASGLDIVQECQAANGAEFDIFVGYDGNQQLIFSGVVDGCHLNWDENKFDVYGRDHAASLADGKQTMAGFNYRNQTVAQIVQQIAAKFGFKTNITDPGIKAGPTMNGENFYNPHPQSFWSMLQSLAESVGYECYMTPDQTLYFGPEQGQGLINVNYGAPSGSNAENPGWGLTLDYTPRNNSNVTVKVLSVNTQTAQRFVGSAEASPLNFKKGSKKSTSMVASNSKARYPKAGSSGSKAPPKTYLYYRLPGLSAEQAQAKAQSIADDLAKHQIVASMTIEGNPNVVLHSQIQVLETTIDLYSFAGVTLNVAEVTHSFSMPDGDQSGGFTTSFSALAQVS